MQEQQAVTEVFGSLGTLGYMASAVAFFGLFVLVWMSRTAWQRKWLLAATCLATAGWAAVVAISLTKGTTPLFTFTVEVVRTVGWLFFLGQLLRVHQTGVRGQRFTLTVFFIVGVAAMVPILVYHTLVMANIYPVLQENYAVVTRIAHVTLSVLGLLLVENLFRNADEDGRWSFKHLCFGVGTLFAYDFFLYADAALFKRIDPDLYLARGFVDAIAVPLIGISVSRMKSWDAEIHLSRRVVFHTAALVGSGLYLLLMSGAGYLIRNAEETWGPVLQMVFLVGALLVTLLLFSSGAVRARIRVWISKHFFQYAHDYREVWLRFTHTISEDSEGRSLHGRIIRAVADTVDCTSAGLWVYREGDKAFLPTARWNFSGPLPGDEFPGLSESAQMIGYLTETKWVVDLSDYRADPDSYDGLDPPEWLLTHPRALIVLPLFHRDALWAFLVLGAPRTPLDLDWETLDLLKTVARQAAGYLAEEHAMSALSDARRLEAFNRRTAFIIHDIKNLVSQMSLMVQNAEKYGQNPDFQKDMQLTVRNSVTRMKELLAQFKAENTLEEVEDGAAETGTSKPEAAPSGLGTAGSPLREVMDRVAENWRAQKPDLRVEVEDPGPTRVDGEKLTAALNHLLQNAVEAAGTDGMVALALRREGSSVVVEVSDDGPGMEPEFVRERLFRPLETAKDAGYGLGAFQTRQMVNEMGGRLEVVTAPGHGTRMQVYLPAA